MDFELNGDRDEAENIARLIADRDAALQAGDTAAPAGEARSITAGNER